MLRKGAMFIGMALLFSVSLVAGARDEFIVVGSRAEIGIVSLESSSVVMRASLEAMEEDETLTEAIVGEDCKGQLTVFFSRYSTPARFACRPLEINPGMESLESIQLGYSRGVLYDPKQKSAVIAISALNYAKRDTSSTVPLFGAVLGEGTLSSSAIDDCLFINSHIQREPIGGIAQIPCNHFRDVFPQVRGPLPDRSSAVWNLSGQSGTLRGYTLAPPDHAEEGSNMSNWSAFVERGKGRGIVVQNHFVGDCLVFSQVGVIVQEMFRFRTGGWPKRSGDYSFFFPGAESLVECELDPAMEIVYANSTSAWFGKGNELWKMAISSKGCETAWKVMDVGFEPFRLFEIPTKFQPRAREILEAGKR